MKTDSNNKLVIIDEVLERFTGHPYAYDKAVQEIFEHRNWSVPVYGHASMLPEIANELKAHPHFNINTQSSIRKIPVLGAILYRWGFWKDYQQYLEQILIQHPTGVLFFPNVYWYNILPIARVLASTQRRAALLYRTSIYDTIGLPKSAISITQWLIAHSVKLLTANAHVHYCTDSEVIANEWENKYKHKMAVLPIPHLTINRKPEGLGYTDKITLYLPGGMRLEKGAAMLTEAMELLAKSQPELLSRVILVTQFPAKDEQLAPFKNRLEQLPINNQFLSHLSTEEYNYRLATADVILIPYQVGEGYRARTSGILAEAIASAKPFITTDGTWMSLQARKYDTGLVIADGQPQQLADAIVQLVNNYSHYEAKAATACDAWMNAQSEDVFFSTLVHQ